MKAAALHQNHLNLNLNLNLRKLLTYTLCALIPLALLHYYLLDPFPFFPFPAPSISPPSQIHINTQINLPSFTPPPLLQLQPRSQSQLQSPCDYSAGTWVPDPRSPLYNGTTCNTIKENQNCMAHGRPDTAYLFWRWHPTQSHCTLPRFDPSAFLHFIRNRHLAFIGDSLARNQAESLMCLLATASQPQLVYQDSTEKRFRRWIFPSHNATVSIYWSPFLVKRIEKSEKDGIRHNRVFLDSFDERWISEFESMDVIVFSLGHWFLIPGIYYEKEQIIGCHVCPEFNHTEIGFFEVFGKAVKRTLEEVRRRHVEGKRERKRLVAVTTFTQAHFEGEWDKAGSCSKTEPYKEGQVQMEYTTGEMRRLALRALETVRSTQPGPDGPDLHFHALDVTRLALLRPDGHPGPYMYPDPFANGNRKPGDRVQNDCVHWCMPGPVDTFNEILSQRIAQSGLFP